MLKVFLQYPYFDIFLFMQKSFFIKKIVVLISSQLKINSALTFLGLRYKL